MAYDSMQDKIKEYQGNSPLTQKIEENDEDDAKYEIFQNAIQDPVTAARELYCSGDKSFDKVVELLIKWLEKCKGKEKELMKDEEE